METYGINKLFDTLGGALNIFDFSFFISGSVTLSIIISGISVHVGWLWLNSLESIPTWILVLSILMSIYVCGLISWVIGKQIRLASISDNGQSTSPEMYDFTQTFDALVESLSLQNNALPQINNKMDIYYYMWIKLDSIKENQNIKGRLAYCNRLWVMRALFEGLLFSWLLGMILLIDLVIFVRCFNFSDLWCLLIGIVFLIGLMIFSCRTATDYANNQVKEIVIAYKIYCVEEDSHHHNNE